MKSYIRTYDNILNRTYCSNLIKKFEENFGDGILAEDIITKYDGADLLIGFKEDSKIFEELSDVITIKDYINVNNTLNFEDLILKSENNSKQEKINIIYKTVTPFRYAELNKNIFIDMVA